MVPFSEEPVDHRHQRVEREGKERKNKRQEQQQLKAREARRPFGLCVRMCACVLMFLYIFTSLSSFLSLDLPDRVGDDEREGSAKKRTERWQF